MRPFPLLLILLAIIVIQVRHESPEPATESPLAITQATTTPIYTKLFKDADVYLKDKKAEEAAKKTAIIKGNVPLKITVVPPKAPEPTRPTKEAVVSEMALNQAVRNAGVNILCQTKVSATGFEPITGSGVIIDPRGIIATNAHVAQFFLLKNYLYPNFLSCIVRTGDTATPAYTAELIYIPKVWISKNAKNITDSEVVSTGENDFALLAITGTITGAPLPSSFSFLPYDEYFNDALVREPILASGYPAEFLGGILATKSLAKLSTVSAIEQVYIFPGGSQADIDIFDLSPTLLAQAGASGGPVASFYGGKLIGLIVTSTSGETTNEKVLRAITTSHLSRTMRNEMGMMISQFLIPTPEKLISNFKNAYYREYADIFEKILDGE